MARQQQAMMVFEESLNEFLEQNKDITDTLDQVDGNLKIFLYVWWCKVSNTERNITCHIWKPHPAAVTWVMHEYSIHKENEILWNTKIS